MSVTNRYECRHGPRSNCHACLIPEMAEVLQEAADKVLWFTVADWERWVPKARTVLEKANLIEDCIPADEAEEASRT